MVQYLSVTNDRWGFVMFRLIIVAAFVVANSVWAVDPGVSRLRLERVSNRDRAEKISMSGDSVEVAAPPALLEQLRAGGRVVRLQLPISGGASLDLDLERFEVTTSGTRYVTMSESGPLQGAAPQVHLYRGQVAGVEGSSAFLAVLGDQVVKGHVEAPGLVKIEIASTRPVVAGAAPTWSVRRADTPGTTPDDVPPCAVDQGHRLTDRLAPVTAGVTVAHGPQIAVLAIEGDESFTQLFPDIASAQAYVVALVGAVSEIYERDLDVKLVLSSVRLWPVGSEPFSASDLGGFRNYWLANEPTAGINLVHLLSGRRDLSYGGVAYVGGFCGGPTFGISGFLLGGFPAPVDNPDLGNWDVIVTAHEMGHNLGTFHTHDGYNPPIDQCGGANLWAQGEIMSYCHTLMGGTLNIDMRFSSRIQDVVASEVAFEGCLVFDCNANNIDDAQDIALGGSLDADFDGVPDECQDCNGNSVLDSVDISLGAADVDGNSVPDVCEADCNGNALPDEYDTALGFSADANGNRVPDACEPDCDSDLTPDFVEIAAGGSSSDIDRDQIPDDCQDCNNNGIRDWADLGRPGFIYVADQGSDTVRVYHARSGVLEATLGAGLLADPYDLAFGPDGLLYVTNFANDSVVRIDPYSGAAVMVVTPGTGGLSGATGIAFSGAGRMYVGSLSSNQILEFNSENGAFVGVVVESGVGGLVGPGHLDIDSPSHIVVGTSNDAILRYLVTTSTDIRTPVATPSEGGLSGLRQFAVQLVGSSFRYHAASSATNQILIYQSGFQGVFNDEYPLTTPSGLALDWKGNVLAARAGVQPIRIIEYSSDDGRYLRSFIRGDFGLTQPNAIAIGPPNNIPDCNQNWRDDVCELAAGWSQDVDENGVLDECQQSFSLMSDDLDYGTRALRIAYSGVGMGPAPPTQAIRLSMMDLMNPIPPPPPCCPAPNYSLFELPMCSAAGEENGCERWLGPPIRYFEAVNNIHSPSYLASRVQCTPYYTDWGAFGWFDVIGPEVLPSSTYELEAVSDSCMGNEASCTEVSPIVVAKTRRAGDIAPNFTPPSTTAQPDGLDVTAAVDKFRGVAGAPRKSIAQIQPNSPNPITDISALDIVHVVDNFRGFRYAYAGPCACPSTVVCNSIPCTSDSQCDKALCVRTCVGGIHDGRDCITEQNCNRCIGGVDDGLPCNPAMLSACPGGNCSNDSTCGPGFCRDRCGRCRN